MTTAERVLAPYVQIKPKRLVGKHIDSVYYDDDGIIIVTRERCYVKLEPRQTWDDCVELEEVKLDMQDMKPMIPDSVWLEHLEEETVAFYQRKMEAEAQRFKTAAMNLGMGIKAVEKILQDHLTN